MSYAYRQDLNWLVTDFTTRVADVAHAVVVSADGVPLALSEHIPHQFAEQLARAGIDVVQDRCLMVEMRHHGKRPLR